MVSACEESVNLDLPKGTPRVVIGGWISDEAVPYRITVSQTIGFNDQETDPAIQARNVYVTDNFSNRYDFEHTQEQGVYESDPLDFVGVVGRRYTLHVIFFDETRFQSTTETLQKVSQLDTIFFEPSFDPEFVIDDPRASIFLIRGRIDDIPNVENYYQWKVYVNDTLRSRPEELIIFNDKFTDGNFFETRITNLFLKQKDTVRIEHSSISEQAFDFYSLLISQTQSNRVGPGSLPTPVVGNMGNVTNPQEMVLGYFGASQIQTRVAIVDQ